MARVVRRIARKIRWMRFLDRMRCRTSKDVIVLSHAPLAGVHDLSDPCHAGFGCFRRFVCAISPVLWIHGHIHRPMSHENQVTEIGKTTVVNAYGHKFIRIGKEGISVSYKEAILYR